MPYVLTENQNYAIDELTKLFKNNLNPICSLAVGEGKTIIACTIIKKHLLEGSTRILIIVKANNLEDPWITELDKFDIKYFLLHGKERKRKIINKKYITKKGYVFLTSHDTSALDIENITNMGQFDLLIVDEIHSIINSNKITQKCDQLIKINSKKKLFLTASPIQNKRDELGLIYILLNKPETYFQLNQSKELNEKFYDEAYNEAIEKRIIVQTLINNNNKKKQKNSNIEKKTIILSIPLNKDMEEFINNNRRYLLLKSQEKYHYTPRLEQFMSHPYSIYKNNTIINKNIKCGKLEAVDIILKNISRNDKIIIFSLYKNVLFQYSKHLKNNGFNPITITGEDKTDLKRKLNLFKKNPNFNILLSTLFKSAEGINMPEANHVIILEFWWNPQKIIQAIGRIDRHIQKKNIFAYLLCYNKYGEIIEIDSKVYEVMEAKINEAKKVVRSQQTLPKIKTFADESTFKDELASFLKEFINYRSDEIISYEEFIEKNEKIGNKSNHTLLDVLNNMKKIRPLADQSFSKDTSLDDIDLSTPQMPTKKFHKTNLRQVNIHESLEMTPILNSDHTFDDLDLSGLPEDK